MGQCNEQESKIVEAPPARPVSGYENGSIMQAARIKALVDGEKRLRECIAQLDATVARLMKQIGELRESVGQRDRRIKELEQTLS